MSTDDLSWTPELRREFDDNAFNGRVGQRLLSDTERVRVWEIRLAPGERLAAHRHVLDYFWTAVDAGSGRSHASDGTTSDVEYHRGETRHHSFARGDYLLHDLENTGSTALVFVTVELKGGPNAPLPIDSTAGELKHCPSGGLVSPGGEPSPLVG